MKINKNIKNRKILNSIDLTKIHNPDLKEFYPFVSLLIIIVSLFVNVFLEMEVRRTEYSVIKAHKDHQNLKDDYYLQIAKYAEKTSPSFLHKKATKKLTLKKLKPYQIIQVNEKNLSKNQRKK